jgi:hypothetical protein
MANFDAATQKQTAVLSAIGLLPALQSMYASGKQAQALLALYQSGTDPAFNAAVNALYTASERTELGVMLGHVNTLITTWTNNHAGAVGITP